MEKSASIRITAKIARTTEAEVSRPSESVLPCTCIPAWQPIRPITTAKTGALSMPTVT